MAITESTKWFVGIEDDGQVSIQRTRVINADGELFERHHRVVLEPGQDVSTYPQKVQRVCNTVWTAQVIADYEAAKLT